MLRALRVCPTWSALVQAGVVEGTREAEVGHFESDVVINENVSRTEVSMNNVG